MEFERIIILPRQRAGSLRVDRQDRQFVESIGTNRSCRGATEFKLSQLSLDPDLSD